MYRYPDDFNMPTFPAGPRIAVSRVMAIGIMVIFALIVCVGGMLMWANRSRQIHPFLVSVDNITGAWSVVGHDHGERTISANRAMQESVIARFTQNWFKISLNQSVNDDLWYGFAEQRECNSINKQNRAQIYCSCDQELYNYFTYTIVPDYLVRVAAGETWSVDVNDIYITPTSDVSDNGGTWRVLTKIKTNVGAPIQVMAYVTLGRDLSAYPDTLGFYVMDFNSYRVEM